MLVPSLFANTLVASNTSTIICSADQCLQGYSNTTIGVTIASSGSTSALLLPGQYTSTTNPQFLHDLFTSPSATLSPSPGFKNSSATLVLPLNVVQEPGLSIYSGPLYSGQAAFAAIPSAPIQNNASTPMALRSLALSPGVWIALNSAASGNSRVIVWDSISDTAQLPTTAPSSLALFDVQSASCTPPCSSAGICTAAGTCACTSGFTGELCESCAPGFFGPNCTACPSDCPKCDDGVTGSGHCLVTAAANTPASCNCVNGVCGSDGSCTCTTGFTTAANGTACSQCAPGFFLTSAGDCKICAIACTECAHSTGLCMTCKTGFTVDAADHTQCIPPPRITSSGTTCPPGSFADGANCNSCSSSCATCTGGTSNDCFECATGTFLLNGKCVSADANGVCEGSSLIADNVKLECDGCGAKCTSCKIPNFNNGSNVDELQCTGCVPGFFLSNGTCVSSCPSGTLVSPQDNSTCTACDSSCTTCTGSTTFCLTCSSNQLAYAGECVATCPANTFSASGSCLSCHPDCATCTGASINQCSSCPSSRPVLTNGRCVSTCNKTQFFDPTSSSCVACDSSCSSCSGSGPSQCLACASANQVLRAGTCVAASCQQVVPGLGVCLSEFVPPAGASSAALPSPSTTRIINTPSAIAAPRHALAWWEILLLALGSAFIVLLVVWLWRCRSRKRRAERTKRWTATQRLEGAGWRWRLLPFGEKLFGHRASEQRAPVQILAPVETELMLERMRAAEEGHDGREEEGHDGREEEGHDGREEEGHDGRDMDKLLAAYEYPRGEERDAHHQHYLHLQRHDSYSSLSDQASTLSSQSLYTQVTGEPHRAPETKEPVRPPKGERDLTHFSTSTIATYYMTTAPGHAPAPPTSSSFF
ncbi:insulin-like growth factor binding protein [Mycena pura]|uniref:Insulin-like growth factor binding protein n=1 Tax=Mycena pura TaxID=153505 RepID=A0AAD6V4D4_9AGAR|nr:insulin-like growth factor binding protein [Mycena pura]